MDSILSTFYSTKVNLNESKHLGIFRLCLSYAEKTKPAVFRGQAYGFFTAKAVNHCGANRKTCHF
jgi:hypothetical protein